MSYWVFKFKTSQYKDNCHELIEYNAISLGIFNFISNINNDFLRQEEAIVINYEYFSASSKITTIIAEVHSKQKYYFKIVNQKRMHILMILKDAYIKEKKKYKIEEVNNVILNAILINLSIVF